MTRALGRVTGLCGGLLLSLALMSCGGGSDGSSFSGSSGSSGGGSSSGGSAPTGANVAPVTVSRGATNDSVNELFVSVTVCIPGGSSCQTVDNIQVDTQSVGLRILGSVLNLALPTQTAANGGTLLECLNFVDGYVWGPLALADVTIGGESASSVPVHVIGDSRFPNVPSDCPSTSMEEDTVTSFGANGILGVSSSMYDCGDGCAPPSLASGNQYYSCTSSSASTCVQSTATLAQQLQSVVAKFATDNNGVMIDLPAVADPAAGAATLSGSLIFGIDTQSNNASGTQTVLTTDSANDLTIQFNGRSLNTSFIDSGTNGIYFNNSSLAQCTQSGLQGFYCPATTQALTATLLGQNGVSVAVNFGVANADTMLNNNPAYAVFPDLGGTYADNNSFDFGLPFFYGRRVAVAMAGVTTTVGTGPYLAF